MTVFTALAAKLTPIPALVIRLNPAVIVLKRDSDGLLWPTPTPPIGVLVPPTPPPVPPEPPWSWLMAVSSTRIERSLPSIESNSVFA
jgi:hypothetical protein